MGLTKIGIDYLENRVRDMIVRIPETMNSDELLGFANGYKQCMDDVFAILAELKRTELHCEETNAYLTVMQKGLSG